MKTVSDTGRRRIKENYFCNGRNGRSLNVQWNFFSLKRLSLKAKASTSKNGGTVAQPSCRECKAVMMLETYSQSIKCFLSKRSILNCLELLSNAKS